MKYILNKYHFNIPDEELINDLRTTARRLGRKTLSATLYGAAGKYSPSTLQVRLGGWNSALLKAGLSIKKHGRANEEDLMRNIKRMWDKLKRQPLVTELSKPFSDYAANTYTKYFGSWRGALEEFVRRSGGRRNKITGRKRPFSPEKILRRRLHVNKLLRFDVLQRDSFRCRLCGASPAISAGVILHVDHIKPRSKGGEAVIENLQTLCSDCNYGKRDR